MRPNFPCQNPELPAMDPKRRIVKARTQKTNTTARAVHCRVKACLARSEMCFIRGCHASLCHPGAIPSHRFVLAPPPRNNSTQTPTTPPRKKRKKAPLGGRGGALVGNLGRPWTMSRFCHASHTFRDVAQDTHENHAPNGPSR